MAKNRQSRTSDGEARAVGAPTARAETPARAKNLLYYGDNLDVLERHIAPESVDLVYLDPPFNSNADYNVLFQEKDGKRAAAQIQAFTDTWEWNQESARAYEQVVEAGGDVAQTMKAFRTMVDESDMLAYLSMMAPRLVALRRVLKPTGSLYLHCDPTASHYLKLLLDAVFGPDHFVNEIIWHYRKWPAGKYGFQRNHDVLLFYARTGTRDRTFNQLFMERAASTLKRFGRARIVSGHDEEGRRVPSQTGTEESLGVRMDDVWDIGRVPPIKQLFPTEKPPRLLARLIAASSNPGDVVLDPFAGCGTAAVVAQAMKRRWIGIDITHVAVGLIKSRLVDAFGPSVMDEVTIIGEPVSVEDAAVLAREDPFQFQAWALGLVGARQAGEPKKGADKGIDGRVYFHDEPTGGKTKQVIISVKAGKLKAEHVRDLAGVVKQEDADIGALISFEQPTKPMQAWAAGAGFYESPWGKHPRMQLVTVQELLEGKRLDYPPSNATFKQAEPLLPEEAESLPLPFGDDDS